ncbi:hypothetical protein [Actinomyces howellii]|uniref:Uncharacterized protein n=1 Tax=Actinomyces howellii TaxID=52771 RepID=A0A3S4RAZ2_9ACTO|nr:hypothetical protein [Actinomyces howellii]VEG28272.1 Uncharacterised protein [Actinomyces howellii]
MRLPGRRRQSSDPAGSPGAGADDPTRFQPGGTSAQDAQDYAASLSPAEAGPGPEDPRRRAARLRRRRRLLTWGGVPAVLVLIVSVWMVLVWGLTTAANRAAVQGDYDLAASRYRTVSTINPLLEQWRVHYNLGTALLMAEDLDAAAAELEAALPLAPRAQTVTAQDADGNAVEIKDPYAPECLVRVNLYVTRSAQAQVATEAGDTAGAQEHNAQATSAAGECEIPPPQSADPTASPSQTSQPSPSPTSTADPSSSPSSSPTPDPSSSPSSSASPSSSPGASESASPSPSPTPGQRDELEQRNNDANEGDGSGVSSGRRW